jgi:hypothetical protein
MYIFYEQGEIMNVKEIMAELQKVAGLIELDYTPLDLGDFHKEGEAPTRQTWEAAKRLVDFKNKWVLNVGACCGFMADKLLREGKADWVVAIEISPHKAEAIRLVLDFNEAHGYSILNASWLDADIPQGPKTEKWTVTMFNVMHHFREKWPDLRNKIPGKDYRIKALDKLFKLPVGTVIFECTHDDLELIEEYRPEHSDIHILPSPGRPSRNMVVVRC